MKTQSRTNSYFTVSKTLSQVLLATLILAAIAIMLPSRSEAGIRVSARIGSVRVNVHSDACCTAPVVATRKVVVRSKGRERIVVRNDYRYDYGYDHAQARHCNHVAKYDKHHHRHGKVWVPGHYETKVKRHGRLKRIWVAGHWTRI